MRNTPYGVFSDVLRQCHQRTSNSNQWIKEIILELLIHVKLFGHALHSQSLNLTPRAGRKSNEGARQRSFHEKARNVKGRRGDPYPNYSQTYALLPRFHPHS
jgi:hypothetical protein